MAENLLPPRFDPSLVTTEINGKAYALSELTHADLLQVACESAQALEMLDELCQHGRKVLVDWQRGQLAPDPR